MSKSLVLYHSDFNGLWVKNSDGDLKEACETFDELIITSADTGNVGYRTMKMRVDDILTRLKPGTKVALGTSSLTTEAPYKPCLKTFQSLYPELEFTGVYFNEESFLHPRFYRIWRELNKIKEDKIWIPYTGSWSKSPLTMTQIALLSRKFQRVYVQPNFYQERYGKDVFSARQAGNMVRFIQNHNLGIEFEIDEHAFTDDKWAMPRALGYFAMLAVYGDIEKKAFYVGGLGLLELRALSYDWDSEHALDYYAELRKL